MKISFCIFYFVVTIPIFAQDNLIVNPDFMEMNWCWYPQNSDYKYQGCQKFPPIKLNENKRFNNLSQFSNNTYSLINEGGVVSFFVNGSTDTYVFTDSRNYVGMNSTGVQGIFNNKGNMGLNLLSRKYDDIRSFVLGRITTPLEKGCRYKFQVELQGSGQSNAATNSFGVAFLTDSLPTQSYFDILSTVKPDIENPDSNWLINDVKVKVAGTFIAKGNERYFLLGNFKTNDSTNVIPGYMGFDANGPFYNDYLSIYQLSGLSLISEIPTGLNLDLPNEVILCKDQIIELSPKAGMLNYTWSTGDTSRILKVNKAGTYYLKSSFGCGYIRDTIKIKDYVYKKDQLGIGSFKRKCISDSISVTAVSGFTNYSWNNGSIGRELILKIPGTYSVSVISTEGCLIKDTVEIRNIKNLKPISIGSDTTLCLGQELNLKVEEDSVNILWNNKSTNNTLSVKEEGEYFVQISNQCSSVSDTIKIETIDCSPVFIPNVFTPNGDGINDTFKILTSQIRPFKLKISSRWGEIIYNENEYYSNWQAENVPDGVYFYELNDSEYHKDYKGVVQILR